MRNKGIMVLLSVCFVGFLFCSTSFADTASDLIIEQARHEAEILDAVVAGLGLLWNDRYAAYSANPSGGTVPSWPADLAELQAAGYITQTILQEANARNYTMTFVATTHPVLQDILLSGNIKAGLLTYFKNFVPAAVIDTAAGTFSVRVNRPKAFVGSQLFVRRDGIWDTGLVGANATFDGNPTLAIRDDPTHTLHRSITIDTNGLLHFYQGGRIRLDTGSQIDFSDNGLLQAGENFSIFLGNAATLETGDTFQLTSGNNTTVTFGGNSELNFTGNNGAVSGVANLTMVGAGQINDLKTIIAALSGGTRRLDLTVNRLNLTETLTEIDGKIRFLSDISITGNLAVSGSLTANSLNISGATTLNTLTVNGTATFNTRVRARNASNANGYVLVEGDSIPWNNISNLPSQLSDLSNLMLKSVYDTNKDGIVDKAHQATLFGTRGSQSAWESYITGLMNSPSGWDKSFSSNGYQKLPSGLIIQWMKANSNGSKQYFPIPFPTACLGLANSTGATLNWGNSLPGGGGFDRTGVWGYTYDFGGSPYNSYPVIIAVGY